MSLVVRAILDKHGRLAVPVDQLSDRDDLRKAGLDSMAMVNVLLGLELELNVEFPEELMQSRCFGSISGIDDMIRQVVPHFDSLGSLSHGN